MPHVSGGFRGTRVGVTEGSRSGLQPENQNALPAPRMSVSYWCSRGHETVTVFARIPAEQVPPSWDCLRCGGAAVRTPGAEPPPQGEQYKTHLQYVKERRTAAEGAVLLEAALAKVRTGRGLPQS